MSYNSAKDTIKHIYQVRKFIDQISSILDERGLLHDKSKLFSPEKEYFDKYTPILSDLTYGSKEYKDNLNQMKPAIDHHQLSNRHHPEYFKEKGVEGMNLIDLIEMICDWKAATLRHKDGDIRKSLEINKGRFNINETLYNILLNTVNNMEW